MPNDPIIFGDEPTPFVVPEVLPDPESIRVNVGGTRLTLRAAGAVDLLHDETIERLMHAAHAIDTVDNPGAARLTIVDTLRAVALRVRPAWATLDLATDVPTGRTFYRYTFGATVGTVPPVDAEDTFEDDDA